MTEPEVDILLPYWGDVELVKQTIDSVLAQTRGDWHLFVVDDHYPSSDVEDYVNSLNDLRIDYIRHEDNIGITNNFNYCVDIATAKHCVVVGCDDILLPNYLETALKNIGSADMYQPMVDVIDADGRSYFPIVDRVKKFLRPKKEGLYSGESLAISLCRGHWLYFPSMMWKTKTLKRYPFDPNYKIAEDVVVQLNIIIDGGTLYLDNETTFKYRRFANSLSSKEKGKGGVRFKEEAAVYKEFDKKFRIIGWNKAARTAKLRIVSRLHELYS